MKPLAVQINFPFCPRRCTHCTRPSWSGFDEAQRAGYLAVLETEIANAAQDLEGFEIVSVRLGGGTITNIAPGQISSLLGRLRSECRVAPDAEVLADVMPGRIGKEGLAGLLDAGITKIALHAETTQGRECKALARACDAGDLRYAFQLFEQEGFEDYGLELALGLAGQTLESYRMTLSEAVFYLPKWVELYTKTSRSQEGKLPSQKALTGMYEHTQKLLASCKYAQVTDELFALPGYAPVAPVHEARNGCVAGFGAGAVTFLDDIVFQNVADPAAYVMAGGDAEATIAAGGMLSAYEQELRAFNQQLHLAGGVDAQTVAGSLAPNIELAQQNGLLEQLGGRYRRTAAAIASGREFLG